jgi:hypothetical protein
MIKQMLNFFKKKPSAQSKRLIGSELIAKVKELDHLSKTEIAIACGYVSKMKDGSDRVDFSAFYEAILNAKGKGLGDSLAGGHRKLSYVATVQGNGNLLIGKAYTAMLDLQVGDEFEIRLGKNRISLTRCGAFKEMEDN